MHNKISNKLNAWLTFLCQDNPEWIMKLIDEYPEFKTMYEDIYNICLNIEKVMGMFSKELQELDKNTVMYMIDEMQNVIDSQKDALSKKDDIINEKENIIRQLNERLAQLEK